jgi:hypothetical protein
MDVMKMYLHIKIESFIFELKRLGWWNLDEVMSCTSNTSHSLPERKNDLAASIPQKAPHHFISH